MTISLMKKITLSFVRDDVSNKGYYDTSGDWVEATTKTVSLEGSLQPFSSMANGEVRAIEAAGYSSSDVRVFYTKDILYTLNQHTGIKPDQTTIDGLTYDVFSVKDWNISGLDSSHYKALLARKTFPSGV